MLTDSIWETCERSVTLPKEDEDGTVEAVKMFALSTANFSAASAAAFASSSSVGRVLPSALAARSAAKRFIRAALTLASSFAASAASFLIATSISIRKMAFETTSFMCITDSVSSPSSEES